MPGRMLSRQAYRIYLFVIIAMVAYLVWEFISGRGVVHWLNEMQALHIFNAYYYLELSILVLVIPAVLAA